MSETLSTIGLWNGVDDETVAGVVRPWLFAKFEYRTVTMCAVIMLPPTWRRSDARGSMELESKTQTNVLAPGFDPAVQQDSSTSISDESLLGNEANLQPLWLKRWLRSPGRRDCAGAKAPRPQCQLA